MTPVNAVNESESAADLRYPSPGEPGYDEFRKTGVHPDFQETPREDEKEKPETQVQEHETPSSEEEASAASVESVTPPASEAVRPQKKDAAARLKEVLAERKEDKRLLRDAIERLAKLELPSNNAKTLESQPAAEAERKPRTEAAKPEPQIDDKDDKGVGKYKTYAEYQSAWSKWVREEAVREARAAATDYTTKSQKEQEAQRATQVVAQVWSGRVNEARKKHADFDQVALNPNLPIKQGSITDAFILDSDHGTDVLYHLAQNPDELTRIQALNPLAQARELFKIEQTFAAPPKPAPKPAPRVTQAPPPPHQVTGKPSNDMDEAERAVKEGDQEAFVRIENEKQLAKLRQGRRRA